VIGSAPVVGERAVSAARTRTAGAVLCVAATVAVGCSTWAILDRREELGGVAALVAGVLLVAAGLLLSRSPAPRWRMLLSFADRAFDGAILGAVAWVTRVDDPSTAAGALLALAAGFLAAYVRARGAALGYFVEESPATRAVRCGLISVALIAGWTSWALYVVAIWMLLVALVRASQVAKEERA
jgi:hypothetical protein